MKLFGVATNPLEFCHWLKENNIKYSFNSLRMLCKVAVFDSVFQLLLHKANLGNRIILVFDVKDKLQTLTPMQLITSTNTHQLKLLLKLDGDVGPPQKVESNESDYVHSTIEANKKNSGVMHKYNTLIYKISVKELREQLQQLIYSYVSGNLSYERISLMIEEVRLLRRNETTRDNVKNLIELIQSKDFLSIRETLMFIFASKKPVDDELIEEVALKNKVEPYDVRYLYHKILSERKGKK